MLGASARYSRLHTPVETSAAPRRDKLRILRFRLKGENSLAPLSLLSPSNPPGAGLRWGPGDGKGHRVGGTGLCWDKLRILRFRPEGENSLAPLSLLSPSNPPRLGFDGDPGGGEGHRAGGTGLR